MTTLRNVTCTVTYSVTRGVTEQRCEGESGPTDGSGLLLEDRTGFLLLESGDFLLLE